MAGLTGAQAVARIQEGLDFANRQASVIEARLNEAQRDLEQGKTLPRFLLQESQTLTLLSGTSAVALPTGFLRFFDDELPHFIDSTTERPKFISIVRSYAEALNANFSEESEVPKVAVLRNTVLDFINEVSQTYTLTWSYYKAADPVVNDGSTNAWLINAPNWLVGEAGYRIAKNIRDAQAAQDFAEMAQKGRAACFGEIIASEEAAGGVSMGENL